MEEYAGYYATMLAPPAQKTCRLHFFSEAFTIDELCAVIGELAAGCREEVQRPLQEQYLGYVVIRPLPSAPIGRTVLRPYNQDSRRCFAPAAMTNRVHLAGLSLTVEGLPFQQQDQGVGACATTALWSALAKVMRNDGQRHPTPLAITRAAIESGVQSRAFPAAAGLDLEQMASAIHRTGYQPHVFGVSNQFESFVLALGCYLRSGIPVVARVRGEQGGHAMTLAGFRSSDTLGPEEDIAIPSGKPSYALRARGIVRWYVHDDRLGPYARLGFRESPGAALHELCLQPREDGFDDFKQPMSFIDALVPLYPKLRLTAEELIDFALDMLPLLTHLVRDSAPKHVDYQEGHLYVEPRFALGGDYLAELHAKPIDSRRKVAFMTTALLSRYVGILSWFVGEHWICDVVYDTTDLRRDLLTGPPILGIIPRHEHLQHALEQFRQEASLGLRPVLGPHPVIA